MLFEGYTHKLLDENNKKRKTYEAKDVDELFNILSKEGFRYLGTGDFLERVFIKENGECTPDIIVIEKEGTWNIVLSFFAIINSYIMEVNAYERKFCISI